MFYCKRDDGSLSLVSLEHAIPIMLRHRLDQLRSSTRSDPGVVALQKVEPARSQLVKIDTPVMRQCIHLRSSEDVQKNGVFRLQKGSGHRISLLDHPANCT